jgi:hypothetical protein
MKRKNRLLRIDDETLEKMKKIKREMERLENKDLCLGELVKRAISSKDIENSLLLGSRNRRLGLK